MYIKTHPPLHIPVYLLLIRTSTSLRYSNRWKLNLVWFIFTSTNILSYHDREPLSHHLSAPPLCVNSGQFSVTTFCWRIWNNSRHAQSYPCRGCSCRPAAELHLSYVVLQSQSYTNISEIAGDASLQILDDDTYVV
jgi:hypothetical protein